VRAAFHEDPEGAISDGEVVEVFHHEPRKLVEVEVDGQIIRATPKHPFYVRGRGWTAAAELRSGDAMRTASGGWTAVGSVVENGHIEPVYNFTVAGLHTYFVRNGSGDAAVLVHNDSGDVTRKELLSKDARDLVAARLGQGDATLVTGGYDIVTPSYKGQDILPVDDLRDVECSIMTRSINASKPIGVVAMVGHGGWNMFKFGLASLTDDPKWSRERVRDILAARDDHNLSAATLSDRNAKYVGNEFKKLVDGGYLATNCIIVLYGCNTGVEKTTSGYAYRVAKYSGLTVIGNGGYSNTVRNIAINYLSFDTAITCTEAPNGLAKTDEHDPSQKDKIYEFVPEK
jgi:hypothetical protein